MKETRLYRHLPETPGVYLMKNTRGSVLYVGKAGNLRHRVASYFTRLPAGRHGPHDERIQKLVSQIKYIGYEKTDTVIEALIREAELIKKLKPPFNIKEKDDKSFLYVEITKEKFPRVLLARTKGTYGPFTSAKSIREALRIIRRIFPYHIHTKEQVQKAKRPCFEYEVGLCPGICISALSAKDYKKNTNNIKRFFEGKKKQIARALKKEMEVASKALNFEQAGKIKRQIFALQHIEDVALIQDPEPLNVKLTNLKTLRIEGYDISNISGTFATGSMVVFINGKPDKNEYRKFKIKTISQSNDVGMLKEMLRRRLRKIPGTSGWPLPDCMLIDGGRGQVNAVQAVQAEFDLAIPVVGIAKGPARKNNEIIGTLPKGIEKATLIKVRDEAHRFAIAYHKKLREHAFFHAQ